MSVRELLDRTKWTIAAGTVMVLGLMAMITLVPPDNQHVQSVVTLVTTSVGILLATRKAEESTTVSKETKDIVDPNVDTEGEHKDGR